MSHDRDVGAFDRRADSYDHGWLGQWHRQVNEHVAAVIATIDPSPVRILDVGCGTGMLLTELARRLPATKQLVGVDPAPAMVAAARAALHDHPQARIEAGHAERLPFGDASFDLVTSTLSFDHWTRQDTGLAECRRVLAPSGQLVLTDLFARWLWPTTVLGRRRTRTPRQAAALLTQAGFNGRNLTWKPITRIGHLPVVQTVSTPPEN